MFPIYIYPPVAKLDIAADSDSEGRGFESLRADHKSTVISIELRRTFSTPQNRLKQGIQAYNKPHHRVLLRKSDPATLNMAVEFFIIRWYN